MEEISQKLVPLLRPLLLHLLYFVLSQPDFEGDRAASLAWETWQRWEQASPGEKFQLRTLFRYVDYLLRRDELGQARRVWEVGLREEGLSSEVGGRGSQVAGRGSEIAGRVVFNGGFESEALNGGFDWVLPHHPDVYYEEDYQTRFRGLVSLRIDSSGESNH